MNADLFQHKFLGYVPCYSTFRWVSRKGSVSDAEKFLVNESWLDGGQVEILDITETRKASELFSSEAATLIYWVLIFLALLFFFKSQQL